MRPLMLWYSRDQTEGDVVRSHDELDAALDRAAALAGPDWPVLAEVPQLENKFGNMIYVGLHLELGALMYSGDDHRGRSFSLGTGCSDGEPLLYMIATSDCEMPSNGEVPAEVVRKAAHEFADTGLRPTCVEWQTWNGPAGPTESEYAPL